MRYEDAYQPDRTLKGKIRRRAVRLFQRRPARAPGKAMISFAFDDAPVTAAHAGAEILEARGMKGVYFIAAGMAGCEGDMGPLTDAEDVKRLAAAGHEIACHTYSHLDCGQADGAKVTADVDRNQQALEGWGLPTPRTFAYPYGDVSAPAKRALAPRFSLMRALHHGLIEAGADLNQAPAVGVEGPDGEATAMAWMRKAAQRRAWLILYTHDVAEDPSSWGCTRGALERLADAAKTMDFEVVTVAEGARRVG